jgi:hypothetical protein
LNDISCSNEGFEIRPFGPASAQPETVGFAEGYALADVGYGE